jgi:hypothetical protein
MSDRRNRADDTGDPRVSAAYREIADERTPEHLDHSILNAARAAARPSWNRAVAWLRPAAWAATIGVCLAIVVDIALLPDHDSADFDSIPQEPLPAAVAERPEYAPPAPSRSRALQRPQDPERPASADPGGRTDGPGEAADAAAQVIEKPRDRARQLTTGDMKATTAKHRAASESDPLAETAAERFCDETETGDPDTWLECILRLEREGLLEAARLERERLAEAFPPPELP